MKILNHNLDGIYEGFEKLIYDNVVAFINGESESIIKTPLGYLHDKLDDKESIQYAMYKRIGDYGAEKILNLFETVEQYPNLKYSRADRSNIVSTIDYTYCFYHAIFEDMLVAVLDSSTPNFDYSIQTRNLGVIEKLISTGHLVVDDIETMRYNLLKGSTRHAMLDYKISTLRFDIIRNATLLNSLDFQLRGIKPQKSLEVGGDNLFVPVSFLVRAYEYLKQLTGDKPFMLFSSSKSGSSKSNYVTLSKNVVDELYLKNTDDITPQEVDTRNSLVQPYFDIIGGRMICYGVTSPFSSTGIKQLRLEKLDGIQIIPSIEYVDTSLYNIEYDLIKPVYMTAINNLNLEKINQLGNGVETVKTLEQKKKYMLSIMYKDSPEKLLSSIIRPNTDVFGVDIEEAIKRRSKVTPKFLKNFQSIDINKYYITNVDNQRLLAKIDVLKSDIITKAKNGIVKLTIVSKHGSIYTRSVSSNYNIFTNRFTLGKNYMRDYETKFRKLLFIAEALKRKKETGITPLQFNAVISEYGIQSIFEDTNIDDYILQGTDKLDVGLLYNHIMNLAREHSDYAYGSKNSKIILRDVYAKYTSTKNLLISIDLRNVIKIEYSEI